MSKQVLISFVIGLLILSSGALYFYLSKSQNDRSLVNGGVESQQKEDSQTSEQAYEDIKIQYENSSMPNDSVPLPLEEDIISLFFHLIDERRIPEAIDMMSEEMVPNDSIKQAWGVQFNDIKSVNVQNITAADQQNWLQNEHKYEIVLEIYVSSDAANAPIPYYGWDDNPNVRWITLIKEDGLWKINSINTGP